MFARIAPRYDFLNRIMSLGRDVTWRKLAVKKAGFAEGATILDLGTGSGDMAQEVLRHTPNAWVIGYDNCAELLNIGRAKISDNAITWLIGDGQRLPFVDQAFTGVVAAFSLRNMSDLSFVFSEIYRVLAPAGKLVFLDMVKPVGFIYKLIFKFHFKYIVPRLGKWLGSDPEAYHYLLPSIENFHTADELKAMLQQADFQQITAQHLMLRTVAICIGTK